MLALFAGIEGGGRELTLEVKLATNQLPIFCSYRFGCLLAPGKTDVRGGQQRVTISRVTGQSDVIEFRVSLQFYGIFRTASDHN
jgi:hypothetical protein